LAWPTAQIIISRQQYIYSFGYISTRSGWELFSFDGELVRKTSWIRDYATASIIRNVSDFKGGENYLIAYICSPSGKGWECGCIDNGDCNHWTIAEFYLEPECQEGKIRCEGSDKTMLCSDGIWILKERCEEGNICSASDGGCV